MLIKLLLNNQKYSEHKKNVDKVVRDTSYSPYLVVIDRDKKAGKELLCT